MSSSSNSGRAYAADNFHDAIPATPSQQEEAGRDTFDVNRNGSSPGFTSSTTSARLVKKVRTTGNGSNKMSGKSMDDLGRAGGSGQSKGKGRESMQLVLGMPSFVTQRYDAEGNIKGGIKDRG